MRQAPDPEPRACRIFLDQSQPGQHPLLAKVSLTCTNYSVSWYSKSDLQLQEHPDGTLVGPPLLSF